MPPTKTATVLLNTIVAKSRGNRPATVPSSSRVTRIRRPTPRPNSKIHNSVRRRTGASARADRRPRRQAVRQLGHDLRALGSRIAGPIADLGQGAAAAAAKARARIDGADLVAGAFEDGHGRWARRAAVPAKIRGGARKATWPP